MKDFWRQVGDGSITRHYLQSVLECPVEKRELVQVQADEKTAPPKLRTTPPPLSDWLKAREELHQFLTGEKIILRDIFSLTEEELASTKLMPAFRPKGATNRDAVNWKVKMGENTPYEEVDVMKYTGSKGGDKPHLFLITRSRTPDADTLGENAKTPDELVAMKEKLWLTLFGWCDADILYAAITGEHLDPNIWTWFPHDRLPDGKVAYGYWFPDRRRVCLSWYFAGHRSGFYGARSAKVVPLTS
jgi:hypothetical protein